jgi:hypothetical protein
MAAAVRCCVEEEGAMQLEEEGNVVEFVAALGSQKREKRVEKGRATAVLWIAAVRWRPVSTSGAPWRAYGKSPGRRYGGGQR